MAVVQRRSSPVGQAMSLDQFLDLPERKPYLEYIDGVVTQKVSPKGEHSTLEYALCELINRLGGPRKLARAFPELRVTFESWSPVPDISVYRWERIERKPNGEVATDFITPPDIAIEIRSPRQSVTKLVARCLWFVSNGARAAVLVDEKARTVLPFRPGQQPVALRGQDRLDLTDIVPDLSVAVDEIFATLRLG